MKKTNKIALSSVVSIVLLLLVMLIATFSVFTFYKNFSSEYSSDLETQINLEEYINLHYIDSNQLYYSNSYFRDLTIDELLIPEEDCSIATTFLQGSNNVTLSGCTLGGVNKIVKVVISLNKNTHSEFVVFRDNY